MEGVLCLLFPPRVLSRSPRCVGIVTTPRPTAWKDQGRVRTSSEGHWLATSLMQIASGRVIQGAHGHREVLCEGSNGRCAVIPCYPPVVASCMLAGAPGCGIYPDPATHQGDACSWKWQIAAGEGGAARGWRSWRACRI